LRLPGTIWLKSPVSAISDRERSLRPGQRRSAESMRFYALQIRCSQEANFIALYVRRRTYRIDLTNDDEESLAECNLHVSAALPWQQTRKLFPDYLVTFACHAFQLWPVEDANPTAQVIDHARSLQFAGRLGDALSSHSKHVGDQVVGHC
jgi:hypothetical protein